MADIQSATAEIRRGKKEEERKRKKPQGKNIMVCPIPYGDHNNRRFALRAMLPVNNAVKPRFHVKIKLF